MNVKLATNNMSKMSDADLQRKEAIEKLKGERIELLEMVNYEGAPDQKENKQILEQLTIIDDQITTLQALDSLQV